MALLAFEQVLAAFLSVNGAAPGAFATSFYVNIWVILTAKEPFDKLRRYLDRLKVTFVRPVIRALLEVLLPFGLRQADPAEPVIALGALDLRASSADERNSRSTLCVRTWLGTLLEVNLVEPGLHKCVLLSDLLHHILILDKQVNAVHEASFERVHVLLAIEAKLMLAVLAFAGVLFFLDISYAAACWNRAPAHVVHGCYGILNTILLVLLHHFSI